MSRASGANIIGCFQPILLILIFHLRLGLKLLLRDRLQDLVHTDRNSFKRWLSILVSPCLSVVVAVTVATAAAFDTNGICIVMEDCLGQLFGTSNLVLVGYFT